ncbi:hypothetical protein [Streptomyces sp. NPDC002767]
MSHSAHPVPSLGRGRRLVVAIRVPRSGTGVSGSGQCTSWADKGYTSKAIRTWLRQRNLAHTIPERADQIADRLRRAGARHPRLTPHASRLTPHASRLTPHVSVILDAGP